MLVLSRKVREEIVITMPTGERVTIIVSEIRGGQVRLAIDAPRQIAVNRGEIQKAIDEGNGRGDVH